MTGTTRLRRRAGEASCPPRRRARVLAAAAVLGALPWFAGHLNSPHVFLEEPIGPYPAVVVVHMPTAIPGEAEVRVRLLDLADGETVEVRVTPLPPQGEQYAPEPTIATASEVDPRFFTAPVPLMEYGVWRIETSVEGARGSGSNRVPVSARVAVPRRIGDQLAGSLVVLCALLFATLWQILAGLGREAHLAPGEEASRRTGRGRFWASIGLVTFALTLSFTIFTWRNFNDRNLRKSGAAYSGTLAPARGEVRAGVPARFELVLAARKGVRTSRWVRDGDHWMHLLLVHRDGGEAFAHVHPTRTGENRFAFAWAPPRAGTWAAFAQFRQEDGERVTVPLSLEVAPGARRAPDVALDAADSRADAAAIGTLPVGAREAETNGGWRVRWAEPEGATIPAGEFVRLRFEWIDPEGRPAPVDAPYDGAGARVWALKDDFSTFAALTPGGTLPGRGAVLREDGAVEIPYGFPTSGVYRLWVQASVDGAVRTGVFDAVVR